MPVKSEEQAIEDINVSDLEEQTASLGSSVRSSFLPRIISLLHILRKAGTDTRVFNHLADQCTSGHRLPTGGNGWERNYSVNSGDGLGSDGGYFVEKISPTMSEYALSLESGRYRNVESSYKSIISLVTTFLITLEKAVCYDVAVLAAFMKKSSSAGSEKNNTEYWQKCFSNGDTFPVDTKYSGGDDNDNLVINTSYSKISHYQMRRFLLKMSCRIAANILDGTSTTLEFSDSSVKPSVSPEDKETIRARVTKLFFTKVDNLNPSRGPVRWKVTSGEFPITGFESKVARDTYNNILPKYIRESEIANQFTNSDDSVSQETIDERQINFEENFSFLMNKENFVPATYITTQELPDVFGVFQYQPNRGTIGDFIEGCIQHREGSRRSYQYLENIKEKYANIKNKIKTMKDLPRAKSLMAIAKLPEIEISDIVDYSGKRQSSLRKVINKQESGLKYNYYLPRGKYLNRSFVENVKSLMTEITKDISGENRGGKPSEGKIYSLGLPYGMIDSRATFHNETSKPEYNKLIYITQDTTMLYNGLEARDINRFYWPSLFIDNVEFSKLPEGLSFEEVREQLNYDIVDENGKLITITFGEVEERLISIITSSGFSAVGDAEHIVGNHLKDFLIKNYLRLYSGIDVNEANFSVARNSNHLYMDQEATDLFDSWGSNLGIPKDQLLSDNKILSFKEFAKSLNSKANEDGDYTTYSDAVALMQSRILTKEHAATKTFVPNIFDRIFCFYTHIAELTFLASDVAAANISGENISIVSGQIRALNLQEGNNGNRLSNDNTTSNIFKVTAI